MLRGIFSDKNALGYVWCQMLITEEQNVGGTVCEVWHSVDRVYVKNQQLQTMFYDEISNISGTEVLSVQINSEGVPVFLVKNQEEVYLQKISVQKEKESSIVKLDRSKDCFQTDYVNRPENLSAIENGLLYCQNNDLFVYRYDTQSLKKLLRLSQYGILSSNICYLSKQGEEIEMILCCEGEESAEFLSFIPGTSDKETITLGVNMSSWDLEQIVTKFNRYSQEYCVEIVDYFQKTGDYDRALEQIKLDLVTGKAPNIISLSGIDTNMLSEKGVLVDLYDLMEKDGEFDCESLVSSVLRAYEDGGHLYSIAPAFQLHSMWGYRDVTEGKCRVTFDELFRILEKNGKDLNAIAGFSGDEPVLTRLCTVSMDEFIDWNSGTCFFEGDYFKKVLSFAKEYKGNYTGGTYSERIRNREVVMSVGIISSVVDYQIQKKLFGEDVSFIGYPVTEDTGTVVSFRGSRVAINAKKENQKGAWEFVKFYIRNGYDGQGFPIMQK